MIDQPSASTPTVGATAVSPEPTAYTTRPITKTRRRPYMSPILPPVSMKAAITRVYRVMTAWMAVTSVSKSSTSWLIETFITEASSTIRNWAVPRTTRGFQRFAMVSCRGSGPSARRTPPR